MQLRVTLFFLLLSLIGQAQIQQGKHLLGGQLSYNNYKSETSAEQKSTNASVGISLGKVYKNNAVIGFKLNYAPSKHEYIYMQADTFSRSQKGYSAGLFLRQYKELGKKFYFFGEGEGGYYHTNTTDDFKTGADTRFLQYGVNFSLNTGMTYFVTDKLMLEVSLPGLMGIQYGSTKNYRDKNEPEHTKGRNFSIYTGLSSNASLSNFAFGFKVLL